MPGIARSRAPAALVICAVQVDAPARDLARGADERERARRGEVEGLQLRRRRRRRARAAAGRRATLAALPSQPASARPSAATMRRWIAAARSYSISCSQIAKASASKGSGRRLDAQPRPAPHRAADQRIAREAAQKRPQVLVDAQREAHALDAVGGGRRASRARAPNSTSVARRLGDAHEHRLLVVVQQPLEHAAATAQQPVHAGARRQAKRARPARPPGAARPRPRPASPALSDPCRGRPSRCTSSRSERLPTICTRSPPPRPDGRAVERRAPRAASAARCAAAGRPGGRPPRRRRSRRPPLPRPARPPPPARAARSPSVFARRSSGASRHARTVPSARPAPAARRPPRRRRRRPARRLSARAGCSSRASVETAADPMWQLPTARARRSCSA